MNNINHLCFDFDGTLIDSFQTIYYTTNETLKRLGITALVKEEDFRLTIGLHFAEIFSKLKIPVNDFEVFISLYKKIYFDFINSSKIYPSVTETLGALNSKGFKISLLTTKAQDQTDKIVDHFNLRKYFSMIMGRREGIANKPSAEPLLLICKQLQVLPSNTIMVGDTELDIRCGKSAGARTCAVNYGYRNSDLLSQEHPDFQINSLAEILALLN